MVELIEKISDIYSICQKKGDIEAEIYAVSSTKNKVNIDQNAIASQSVIVDEGCGIQIIDRNKVGFSYSNNLELKNIERTIDQAISIAQKSTAEKSNILPEQIKYKDMPGTYYQEVADLKAAEICELATEIIDRVTTDPRITLTLSAINSQTRNIAIMNSNDINAHLRDTNLQMQVLGLARDGDKIGSFAGEQRISRRNDIDIDEMMEKAMAKMIHGLKAKPITAKFDGDLIFEPDAMGTPYGITILLNIEGNAVYQKRSAWKDKIGDQVTVEEINIHDLPRDASKPTSRPFDDEGVPTQNRVIVENGILKTFLHTTKSAMKNEVESTGTGYRTLLPSIISYTYLPSYGMPICMTIQPGDMSYEEMIQDTKSGIVIGRYSGHYRYQTGEYSGVVKQALLVEDGEVKHPLIGVMIAGNTFTDLLNINGISKESKNTYGFFTTPSLRVTGINVASSPGDSSSP
ncbi:MAG: TldD/PmbA family protein [Candidatus Kariarchaeaceae archaeon]|jgi:PmbA protein